MSVLLERRFVSTIMSQSPQTQIRKRQNHIQNLFLGREANIGFSSFFLDGLLSCCNYFGGLQLNVEIIRKMTNPSCRFTDHFRNFEHVTAVQRIFGESTQAVLAVLPIEFTNDTIYMRVDYNGCLLINPEYFATGNFTDLYLDVIHELVHVKQVMNGKNCNHSLRYVERPLEIEAYRTTVEEARALGLNETQILEYLESDLIDTDELRLLAEALEVTSEVISMEDD